MFQYVIGACIGAVLMGKTKPKTAMRTVQCFGPRTGVIWTAEIMPGDNVVVLHAPAPDPTLVLFQKNAAGRFILLKALRGYDGTVKLMQRDLEA